MSEPGKIIKYKDGGVSFIGHEATSRYRDMVLATTMAFEIRTGQRMVRGPKAVTIVRREHGFKGRAISVYLQYCAKMVIKPREDIVNLSTIKERELALKVEPFVRNLEIVTE